MTRGFLLALVMAIAALGSARAADSPSTTVKAVFRCYDTLTGQYVVCSGTQENESALDQLGRVVATHIPGGSIDSAALNGEITRAKTAEQTISSQMLSTALIGDTVAGLDANKNLTNNLIGPVNGLAASSLTDGTNIIAPVTGNVNQAMVTASYGLAAANMATRFSRHLDVIYDGAALCDGSTDDSAAITALLASAAGKATVRVPFGVTCRAKSIVLPAYTHLTIDGTLKAVDAADAQLVTINTRDHVTIDGTGVIDGNSSSYPSTDTGVYACINANGGQYFNLEDVTVQNCKNYPINAWNGAAHIYINHVRMLNSGNSPECAQNVDDCWVNNSYISGISDVGWSFYKGVTNSGITNSRATNNSGAGISSYLDNGSTTQSGNQNIIIANNVVDHNGGPGILDQGAGAALASANKNIQIIGNIGSYNDQAGQTGYGCVYLANDYYVNVSDNECSYDGNSTEPVYGIWLQTQNYHVTVHHNKIWNEGIGGTLGVGIQNSGLSYYSQITDNEIFADNSNTSMVFGIGGTMPATGWSVVKNNLTRGLTGGPYTNLLMGATTVFEDDFLIQRVSATGSAITGLNYYGWLYLYQTTTVASQTITLPARAGNGQVFVISSAGPITSLTISAPTNLSVIGVPTAMAAGSSVSFRYDATSSTWVRVQ